MDLGNKTLNGILKTIADENDLVGYNTYRNKRGRIVVNSAMRNHQNWIRKWTQTVSLTQIKIHSKSCQKIKVSEIFTVLGILDAKIHQKAKMRTLSKCLEIQRKIILVNLH